MQNEIVKHVTTETNRKTHLVNVEFRVLIAYARQASLVDVPLRRLTAYEAVRVKLKAGRATR